MPALCKICSHDKRETIDRAILAGTSLRQVASAFAVGRTAVQRHGANHVHAADVRAEVAKTRKQVLTEVAASTPSVSLRIESPSDVLEELRWAYGETKQLYERAKASHDTRLMDKAIGQGGALLEKFAKSFGMYQDGTVVNVNTSTQRLQVAVGRLTDEQLHAALTAIGAGTIPHIPELAATIEGKVVA